MITIGIIGCGYWGPNLVRNFYRLDNTRIKYVAELHEEKRAYIKKYYPTITPLDNYRILLNDPEVDAVIIATPAMNHYAHAKDVLTAGKHCFVEKPLALKTGESQALIALAQQEKKILMVGHTFLYNAAVRYIKNELTQGSLGQVYYLFSQRLNLGTIRKDINAIWNLAPHDISIYLYLLDCCPKWVSCSGMAYILPRIEDVAFITLGFDEGIIANIHVSWLNPQKIRKMTIVGSRKMIVYDDMDSNKIKIYDKGIDKQDIGVSMGDYDDFGKFQLIQRAGDLIIPKIDFIEPLAIESQHFIDCIVNHQLPLTDGDSGMRVTKILEAANASLQQNGKRIHLDFS